jgi:butyrate kinase
MRILSINPGSTSTKIAVYDDLNPVFVQNLKHSADELAPFPSIIHQYDFRKKIIIEFLQTNGVELHTLDAIVGRGGLLKPIPGGVYRVNELMIEDLKKGIQGEHASNLGGILAYEIAKNTGKETPAYIVDPVVVDELDEMARFSGHPLLPRRSIFHALNQKAVARRFAREHGKKYDEITVIVAHLGGGITVGLHKNGKVIDVNNGLDGEGPFSPERTGTLPAGDLVKLCFSGKYELHEVKKMITGKGGFVAYLGTNDAYEVEIRAMEKNDEYARKVFFALAYQVAKEIGYLAPVVAGKLDAILITGGMARSKPITDYITERVQFIAPVHIYPGEDEMQALTEGVYYATKGEIEIKEYV